LQIIIGLIIACLPIAVIVWLGDFAASRIIDFDRYTVKLTDISCNAPPGSDRLIFLTEVRYLSEMPETVQSVDPSLPERLTRAFSRHPWVLRVNSVTVQSGGRDIRVDLVFRTPALAVTVLGDPEPRVVDAEGVLLPPTAPTATLPVFEAEAFPPLVAAGQPWDDPDVQRAAGLAAAYKLTRIKKTAKGWRITRPDGSTAWIGL
jgi:hypothetical protein